MATLAEAEQNYNAQRAAREQGQQAFQQATGEFQEAQKSGITFGDMFKEAIKERAAKQSPLYARNAEAKANYRTFLGDELPKMKGAFENEGDLLGAVDQTRNRKLQDIFHTENLLNAQGGRIEDIIGEASNAYQSNVVMPKQQAVENAATNLSFLDQNTQESYRAFTDAQQQANFERQLASSRSVSANKSVDVKKLLQAEKGIQQIASTNEGRAALAETINKVTQNPLGQVAAGLFGLKVGKATPRNVDERDYLTNLVGSTNQGTGEAIYDWWQGVQANRAEPVKTDLTAVRSDLRAAIQTAKQTYGDDPQAVADAVAGYYPEFTYAQIYSEAGG